LDSFKEEAIVPGSARSPILTRTVPDKLAHPIPIHTR
jgi:hypothetical protein